MNTNPKFLKTWQDVDTFCFNKESDKLKRYLITKDNQWKTYFINSKNGACCCFCSKKDYQKGVFEGGDKLIKKFRFDKLTENQFCQLALRVKKINNILCFDSSQDLYEAIKTSF